MSKLEEIKFFSTAEHPCSYLPEQIAKTVFVDPDEELNSQLYSQLSNLGFRRSGKHVYRPYCENCNACVPIRIPARQFQPTKSQRRCINKNKDLIIDVVNQIDGDEYYNLYEKYIEIRHSDGDMYPASRTQYDDFLTSEWGITQFFTFRTPDKKLIGVSVVDILETGPSAIYFFFDPDEEKRSLGMFNILTLIHWTNEQKLPYTYLGYWIRQCKKMSYKTHFQPFQVFIADSWITVADKKTSN